MFIEVPNFLEASDVEFCRRVFRKFVKDNPNEAMYNRMGKTVSLDDIKLSNDPDVTELHQRLFPVFYKIVKEVAIPNFQPEFEVADSGIEYHLYRPGDVCKFHSDGVAYLGNETRFKTSLLRFATVILHLSTNNDGGDIVFPKQERQFKTEAGKLLMFPPYSFYPHYTTPSSEEREILMTWLVYKDVTVTKK